MQGQQQNQQNQQTIPNTMKQNQQNIQSQPPQVLSTKDVLYLTDMMSWNLTALKKAHFLESQCQIPEISQAMQQACEMHERHYRTILGHLDPTNQPTQSQSQQQQQQQQQQQ
ncbi:hypothetical protein [Litchfieldia alkalitelluris]|uniref:hypothetical protein n=1 Tax=Litchfieldia alkalitelluris TaxID=304268 RepID=UPI001F19B18D|nr:hypothetical protein [Litchfieldia alkalitelluris]